MAIQKPTFTRYKCRPAVPYEKEIPLTIADTALVPAYNSRYLCCFEAPEDTSYQAPLVEGLKKSLEELLADPSEGVLAVPEILGNLYIDPPSKKYVIKITKDSSVDFAVSHRYDFNYEGLEPENGFPMRCLPGDVFATDIEVFPLADKNKEVVPFAAQITFIQRGFVICVSKHHWLLDGTSLSSLIKWWFKKVRSYVENVDLKDTSIIPAEKLAAMHDRTSLLMDSNVAPQEHIQWHVVPGTKQSTIGKIHDENFPGAAPPRDVEQSAMSVTLSKLLPAIRAPTITNSIFHFSPTSLKTLHSILLANTKTRISTNDAVSALIWRCVTRARLAAWDRPSRPEISQLTLAVNGRAKLNPPLVNEYFGNCVFTAPSELPIDLIVSEGASSLAEVAEAVRLSLKTQTNENMRSLIQMAKEQAVLSEMVMKSDIFMGKDIFVTSWEKYWDSLDDLNIGAGTFKRVRLPGGGGFDGFISIMPAYGLRSKAEGEDAKIYTPGLEISLDLLEQHQELLKNDREWLQYGVWMEK